MSIAFVFFTINQRVGVQDPLIRYCVQNGCRVVLLPSIFTAVGTCVLAQKSLGWHLEGTTPTGWLEQCGWNHPVRSLLDDTVASPAKNDKKRKTVKIKQNVVGRML